MAEALHGWLIVDKAVGIGSTQVVSAVKRALRDGGYAKVKVGHGGTLDPLASGVLPVALGEATKLSGRMLDADKAYDFTIGFGIETDTLDAEGRAVATSEVRPTAGALEAVLPRFIGEIEQVPPAYSALKVDGERAYDLARAGETVELPSRGVTVHTLEFLPELVSGRGTAAAGGGGGAGRGSLPLHHSVRERSPSLRKLGEELQEATLSARVSKGTYIRSLARDIARALGTFGHVTMLRRTRAGSFGLGKAILLDFLRDAAKAHALEKALLPLAAGLDDIPALSVTPDQAGALRQGRRVIGTAAHPGLHLALDQGRPVALVEGDGTGLTVVRGFNL